MKRLLNSTYRRGSAFINSHGLSNHRLTGRVRNLIVDRMRAKPVAVRGHRMLLSRRFFVWIKVWDCFEPYETDAIESCVREGDVVLDIGANIGYYTLILARRVGPSGKVFAFEPDPTNCALLKANVALNGYTNVVLIQKAVTAENGRLRLYLSDENEGDHRVFAGPDDRRSIDIEAVRIDDLLDGYEREISFIKIDIQGAEFAALQGMAALLQRCKTIGIATEFTPHALKQFGVEPAAYLDLLRTHGFSLFKIDERSKTLAEMTVEQLMADSDWEMNLLCLRPGVEQRVTVASPKAATDVRAGRERTQARPRGRGDIGAPTAVR